MTPEERDSFREFAEGVGAPPTSALATGDPMTPETPEERQEREHCERAAVGLYSEHDGYADPVALLIRERADARRQALEEAARLADHHCDQAQKNDPEWSIFHWTEGMLASLPDAIRSLRTRS